MAALSSFAYVKLGASGNAMGMLAPSIALRLYLLHCARGIRTSRCSIVQNEPNIIERPSECLRYVSHSTILPAMCVSALSASIVRTLPIRIER